ncbi:SDR family NAD(P)-dependent oxidoreductase [Dyella japonica]|uniref:3-hydroxyacyl-CoA dehydrogenase/NADP-dependent 3-hydroxy acid dehydrogenase YdfG n=1 Tax=Dyella japonica TaxID=231455 RepID=A0ABV2JNK9_9GAMM
MRSVRELFDLTGKTALITGASRGLGLQMAQALGEQGARLVLSARKADELMLAQAQLQTRGIECSAIAADVGRDEDIARMADAAMAALGHIDILVNNAGATWGAPAEDYPTEAWDKVMNLNVRGLFLLTQRVGRLSMIPRRHGRIINVASIAGLAGNAPGSMKTLAYNTSKGAVVNFTRTLAGEWGEYGITVNALAPGFFPTRMTRGLLGHLGADHLSAHAPLQRLGDEEDLKGATVLFADLVIEAVFEDMAVKEIVFHQLDEVMKPGAILASNTSTLDVNRIAAFTKRPQDVVGMHFFSPANVMRLLEVVRGAHTGKDVLATVMQLARKIQKMAVVAGVCDGFIGNRMIEQYSRQAGFLLDEGALPAQVDRAIEQFGFAMGPFRMIDMAGNDIAWAIRKRRYLEQPEFTYSRTGDLLCEMGRFGQKTGAGWYDYKPGERAALPSPLVNDMIVRHSKALGLKRRSISDEEIVERLVFAMVNEGALILEEGIASKASDIDMVYLSGYGFPRYRGGPMWYADEVGLYNVMQAIHRYAKGYQGKAWVVAPLIRKLVDAGKTFNA